MMSQFSSGFVVAVAMIPNAITSDTMPSIRSVLFCLLGLMLPAWSCCIATLPAYQSSTGLLCSSLAETTIASSCFAGADMLP